MVSGNPNKYNTEQSTDNITTRHHFLVLRNMYSSRIAVTIVSTIVNIVLRPINTIIVKKRTLQKAGVEKWLTAAGNARKTNPVSEIHTQNLSTVNSEILARILFLRNFVDVKFHENKTLAKW